MSFTLKKATLALMLASVFSVSALAGNDPDYDEDFEVEEDCDLPNITVNRYTEIGCLYDDIAVVRVGDNTDNTRFGMVNADGEEVIAPEYRFFKFFSDDLFIAFDKGLKAGLISRNGEIVLPVIYDFVDSLQSKEHTFDNHAIIQVGKSGDDIKTGLINSQGQIIIEPKYLFIYSASDDNNQLLDVAIKVGDSMDDVKYGLVTYSDQIVAPLIYDAPIHFNGNKWASLCKDNKCNFINTKGELLLPYWADDVGNFSESMAWVKQEGRYGYIDESGQLAIPFTYSEAEGFEQGRAIVVYDDNNLSLAPGWDEAEQWDTYGIIDQDNHAIVPFEYQWIKRINPNLFYIQKSDGFDFVDSDGNLATTKKFDEIVTVSLTDEFFAVKKDGKWGFINRDFETVIPFEYDKAVEFYDDLAAVKKNNKFGFIDKDGQTVIPFDYDDANIDIDDWRTRVDRKYRFGDNMTVVRKAGRWGVIDKGNNIIVPFEYDDAIVETFFQIKATKNGVDYLFDMDGNPVEADDAESLNQ
ncbi:WG repeat-containing protein [Psychrobacter lutiphocae]|uniref:WG repeat-containing protein n=1 Tax=Psychrobacter lutiphocae TaxID=540500 RepID=UPI0003653BDC|nr:WG repeat-containing protein [Psychrobacter lutiphocae]